MTIQRYRRKPERVSDRETFAAARYEPGVPLDDLIAVARMAGGELAEAVFPSGAVLIARFMRSYDEHPSAIDYVAVEAGKYLAYSDGGEFLYETDGDNCRRLYDLVADGEATGTSDT